MRTPVTHQKFALPSAPVCKRTHLFAVDVYGIHFNSLNAELNPICHLLALLGAHPIFHISRIKVKHVSWNTAVVSSQGKTNTAERDAENSKWLMYGFVAAQSLHPLSFRRSLFLRGEFDNLQSLLFIRGSLQNCFFGLHCIQKIYSIFQSLFIMTRHFVNK
jgi:hypothetical protein